MAMSVGNRPLPGISAIPGINKMPGFDGQPFGMPQGRPFGGLGNVASALASRSQYQQPDMPQTQPVLGNTQVQQPPQGVPGAIPRGMQMVNGALEPKPQQQAASPFGSILGGYGRRLWG